MYFVELKRGKTHTNMYLEIWDMLILLITGLCVRRIIATEHYSSLCIQSHGITASNTHSCSNSVSKRYSSLMQTGSVQITYWILRAPLKYQTHKDVLKPLCVLNILMNSCISLSNSFAKIRQRETKQVRPYILFACFF